MGNILVVKLGGGFDVRQACEDLATIAGKQSLIVVHGVSAAMAALCRERDVQIEMLTSPSGHSSRYTNAAVRDLYVEAVNMVNQRVVDYLREQAIPAIGITQQVVIRGERKRAIRAIVDGRTRMIRDDYSGKITEIDPRPILDALVAGQVPVVPPMAFSEEGLLNIDGDRASAAVAGALDAEELIILSNVRGLFRNFPNEDSLVSLVPANQLDRAMQWAQGRMKRKVLGAQEAIEGGVDRVIIGDGRISKPVTQAKRGMGTVFTA